MKVHDSRESRAKAALLFLVLMSLLSVGRSVVNPPRAMQTSGMPNLSQYETRFARVRAVLPRLEVVGYFDDEPNPHYELGDYYAAQYVLTPVIVRRSDDANFVIGNFVCDRCPQRSWPNDLVPVNDFGEGVVLFQKKGR